MQAPHKLNCAVAQAAPESGINWRDHLPIHPLVIDLFPPLSEAELKELSNDILARGLIAPIVIAVSNTGAESLFDGQNRLDAMQMAGLITGIDKDGLRVKRWDNRNHYWCDKDEALYVDRVHDDGKIDLLALALSYNAHRRHLTAKQKRDRIAKVLKGKPQASNLAIAKEVKADDKTVATVRAELQARSEIPNVDTRTDTKGRKQPAKKTKTAKPIAAAKAPPAQPQPRKAVASLNNALSDFSARVLDLVRRIGRHDPAHFAKTTVKADDLSKLGKFLIAVAAKQAPAHANGGAS